MKKYIIFLVALFILASCGSTPPEETDWCYTFDFRGSDNGFNLATGQWVEDEGLQTVGGDLSFSYVHDQFVTPAIVYVYVSRPVGVVGDIPITAAGNIFGISTGFDVTMTTDEETVYFTPASTGDAGTQINVTIDTDTQELNIGWILVEGFGESPFDTNPCNEATPYATNTVTATNTAIFEWTNTPTPTSTATNTPTPSETPTATATPFCYTDNFDFTVTQGGFYKSLPGVTAASGDHAEYNTGEGWTSEKSIYHTHVAHIVKDYGELVTIYNVAYTINGVPEASASIQLYSDLSTLVYTLTDSAPVASYLTTGAISESARYVKLNANDDLDGDPYNSWSGHFTSVTISYCYAAPTPEPTWTPTITDTPSITPTSITAIPGGTQGTPTRTPIVTPSPEDTVAPEITSTPPDTWTPEATFTWIPSPTRYFTQVPAGTNTPTVDEIRENEAEYEILEEIKQNQNWQENTAGQFADFLGDTFGWFFDIFFNFFSWLESLINFILGLISAIIAIIIEILSIILLLIQLALGLIGLLVQWIGQIIAQLTSLITTFFTAPPTPIPGLPLCITEPLNHDICALYYIMDWTIFAPNTAGQFIIPLVLALMNLVIIFRFVQFVLKLIRRGEDVTR